MPDTTTDLDIAVVTEPVLAALQPDNWWRVTENPTGRVVIETSIPEVALSAASPGDVITRRYSRADGSTSWSSIRPAKFPEFEDLPLNLFLKSAAA